MEVIFFILIVLGVIGVPVAFNKPIRNRIVTIARSNKAISPAEKEVDDVQLEKLYKELRDAKDNEQKVLSDDWNEQFIDLLPDSDPLKQQRLRKLAGINSEEARFVVPDPRVEVAPEELSYSLRKTKKGAALRQNPTSYSRELAILKEFVIVKVDGWVYGESIDGNDIWFRIDDANGVFATSYIWSGCMTDKTTSGIPKVSPAQRSLAPAAERDLTREISRLNEQVKALPKNLNFTRQTVTQEQMSEFLIQNLLK